jgi:AcrR family transcriptional regulator
MHKEPTAKGKATRNRIVEGAAVVLREKGVSAATWQQWRDVVVDRYEEQGDQCPLGSLFLHLGRSTPGARAIVIELMHRWQASLAVGIRALQAAGHLPADLDVEHRAAALLAGIQGGVSILQSTGRPDHLRAALDQGIGDLRRAAA